MRRVIREPIIVTVHYPETEEGLKEYKQSHARVVIDILENKLGKERVSELINYMEIKLNEERYKKKL